MKTQSFDANRRNFIKLVMGGGTSLFFPWKGGSGRALAAIPGEMLSPGAIQKFVAAMLIPPVMPKAGTIKRPGGMNIDSYEISVKEFSQQILPPGFPAT
jgi:spore coat protein A